MDFVKMHGLGNDFICLDHFLFPTGMDYAETAVQLCHRQFGVGGDGLIVILPSDVADARMRIFNPDGSEPEMCGNGIRCFAKYVYEAGYVQRDSLKIETLAGVLDVKLEICRGAVHHVTVNMGEPCLDPIKIPVLAGTDTALSQKLEVAGQEYIFSAVSMGNPHCIIFTEDLELLPFETLGPAIEKHPLFPRKTNVEFVKVDNSGEITVKVWERGVGPTLACGTGACASVVAAVLAGRTDRTVIVHLPGGDLKIEWQEGQQVHMTGPAVCVFRGSTLES
ncbi:Diaminopimelate epimerase [Dehalobacter sp. UNSWDHB]|jgi:diaminopimelate epimerase|uniref:diaminopimelate epimerase n=1 Tax=unclassified Dehalobacter TaxID=2635733 RepID=UPI00028B02F4|nr:MULTISPECIES: diaminopimelate epimerase [unclassified Dehalobacter]AFV02470.1 Diaminopimelate epimerase [Dehalobacter sp. DCA]AFV05460.1 Diaminopimelate epimerase [Dehalobacter sp. CF]EQB22323.1 Diaminopimelate epimerase [Dehalobacter sp. UNSWDHB]